MTKAVRRSGCQLVASLGGALVNLAVNRTLLTCGYTLAPGIEYAAGVVEVDAHWIDLGRPTGCAYSCWRALYVTSMTRAVARTEPGVLLDMPASGIGLENVIFGRLTVIGFTGARTRFRQAMLTCRCVCGLYVDVAIHHLRSGNTTSCGCLHADDLAARNSANATHGETRGLKGKTRVSELYRVWNQIKNRCCNPTHEAYADYGGRGITFHTPWRDDYTAFARDIDTTIGRRPSRAYSIDRIDNDRGYEPNNLRWATQAEQNRNRRVTKFHSLNGETKTLAEWCEQAQIHYATAFGRLKNGWPLDEALGTPVGVGRVPLSERKKFVPK